MPMGFIEKFSYLLGRKDPTKPGELDDEQLKNYDMSSNEVLFVDRKPSPLMEAVMNNDIERLAFFLQHSKLSTNDLSKVLTDALPHVCSVKAFDMLISYGAITSKQAVLTAAGNIMKRLVPNRENSDTLKFFKGNDLSLNFNDGQKPAKSLYDCLENKDYVLKVFDPKRGMVEGIDNPKKNWFKKASPEEIGHEFRQAVAFGNFKKVEEMFELGRGKLDVNATNKYGVDAMSYALSIRDPEKSEKMALLLYDMGAKLYKEDNAGLNAFERATPELQKELLSRCLDRNDLMGVGAAAKAGIPLTNTSYLLKTTNPDVMIFLAKQGASIDDAMFTLSKADEAVWGTKENVEQMRILRVAKDDIAQEENYWKDPEAKKNLEHNFRQAVADGRQEDVMRMLTEYRDILDINAQNSKGHTAMMYAARKDNVGMAMLLYKFGADLSIENNEGKNVFSYSGKNIYNTLLPECVERGDEKSLKAAEKAGLNVSLFRNLAKKTDTATTVFANAAANKIDR